jgi:hypothetical protein
MSSPLSVLVLPMALVSLVAYTTVNLPSILMSSPFLVLVFMASILVPLRMIVVLSPLVITPYPLSFSLVVTLPMVYGRLGAP